MLGLFGEQNLAAGQLIGDRAEPFGLAKHVLDGIGKRADPANQGIPEDRVGAQMHGDDPRQVPRLVDKASP